MKKMKTHIICDGCGETFVPGNRPDGMPNGVGFQVEGGKVINVCHDCIVKIGGMDEPERTDYINSLKKSK